MFPKHVLLVEDNDGDVMLARECFKRTGYEVHLHHVPDGECCLAFLRREAPYQDAPNPVLILLDINMPRMNGLEVMAVLAGDERLRRVPTVVLTTSSAPADVRSMLDWRCSSYIVKPHDFDTYQRIVQGLCDYWFGLPGMLSTASIS